MSFFFRLNLLVLHSVKEDVHYAGSFIREFDENIAAILMMEGNQIDVVKIGALYIVHVNGYSILLAQINDASIGKHKMAQLL